MTGTGAARSAGTVRAVTGFLTISVGAALLVPLVTRGSYEALVRTRWRWTSLFVAGLVLQLVSEHLPHPGGHDLGFGALMAGEALLLAFCLRNLVHRGVVVVALGIACNAVAIGVNHGMPVDVPAAWERTGGMATTVKHHPRTSDDRLTWLGDTMYLRVTDEVLSVGDLVLAFGLLDVSFHASRRRRRRSDQARAATTKSNASSTRSSSSSRTLSRS